MAVLLVPPYLQFFDAVGEPLSGGKIYTYAANTTTPKETYTDSTGNFAAQNPVVLDSAGRVTLWGIGSYKIVVKDASGNEIETTDNITTFNAQTSTNEGYFQSFSGDGATTSFTLSENLGTDEKALFIQAELECSTNGKFASDTGWTKGSGWTIAAGVATATGAISTALEQSAGLTLVEGRAYSVKFTITRSAGSITMSLGGTAGTARSADGTYSETIIAGSTQTISFGTAGFTGTLDNVSIVETGGPKTLNPSFYTVDGTALTLTIPPTTGTNNLEVRAPYTLIGAAGAAQVAADDAIAAAAQATGAVDAVAFRYTFDNSTSMADPGTGDFRLNNATIASATAMALDATSASSGNPDVSDAIAAWDASTNTVKGQLKITKSGTPATFALFDVTAVTDNTGWLEVAVTYVDGNGTLTAADVCFLQFAQAGDKGATGNTGATGSIDDISGAPSGTIVSTDTIIFTDADDSNETKKTSIGAATQVAIFDGLIASEAEAEAGTADDKLMTPERTAQAIAALAGGGGGWVPIATITASNDATIDFVNGSGGVVLDGTYKAYAVVILTLVPASDNTNLWFRTSTDGGSTYDASSDYNYAGYNIRTNASSLNAVGQSAQNQYVVVQNCGNQTGEVSNAIIEFFNPASATPLHIMSRATSDNVGSHTNFWTESLMGGNLNEANVDAIRFLMSSDNITSGTFTLYGLASAQ